MTVLAIVLALAAAIALAYGAYYQHAAVADHDDTHAGLSLAHLKSLLTNRTWLLGLFVLGLGMAFNVVALAIAPVMVVQPVGAISLVVSVMLGMHYRGLKVTGPMVRAILWSTLGVVAFVSLAAVIARTEVHLGTNAHPLAWISLGASVVFLIIAVVWRHPPQLLLIAAAGVLFACVATSVHLISVQYLHAGIGAVTWFNVIAGAAAGILGSWFVQNAYAAGPPEMVIAGLTVIDPIIAVVLGAVVLGEASHAAVWFIAVMSLTGLAACFGVVVLSRYHPDVLARSAERKEHRAAQSARNKKDQGVHDAGGPST